jgi:hypothetical protein
MSIVAIRVALETALASITPSIATAYENLAFTPPATNPYQRAFLRLSKPINDETGTRYTENGYLQVSLYYPQGAASVDVETQITLLRQTFVRGVSFTASGVVVTISDVAEVLAGLIDEARWSVTIRIPFSAQITAP